MKRLLIVLPFISTAVSAAPFLISDSTLYIPAPTSCGLYLDATPKQVAPVALDAEGKPYCSFDLTDMATGPHSAQATFIVDDPLWGSRESAKSDPFPFDGPPAPPSPPSTGWLIRVTR